MKSTRATYSHRTRQILERSVLAVIGLQALTLATASADRVVPTWVDVFRNDVPRSQVGRDVTTDPRGNVVTCGYLDDGTTTETFFAAKYDGLHGNLIWSYTFPQGETIASRALSVATDSVGNVIATGWYNTPNGHDYYTVKLGSTTGNVIWERTYNNSAANGSDEGARVVVDSDDSVIVTGASVGSGTQKDIYTIKYLSNGTQDWAYRYNYFAGGSGNRNDYPEALALDSDDNVIVAGTADENGQTLFYTGKIAKESVSPTGVPLWEKTFISGKYGVTGLAVDNDDNVVVTGLKKHLSTVETDLYTIKYSGSNGTQLWAQSYYTEDAGNISLNTEIGRPYWAGVSVDSAGNVYAATTSSAATPQGETQKRRIYLAKYSPAGNFQWETYSVPGKSGTSSGTGDMATGIITDGASNTIVIGTSDSPFDDSQLEYYIARYNGDGGAPTAVYRFNANESGGTDVPAAIALDKNNGAAITGFSRKPAFNGGISYSGASTIKLTRFLAVTGDPATGTGLSSKAKLGTLFTPAVSDTGRVLARVTVADGKKKLGAILVSNPDGTQQLGAIQNNDATGVTGAKFKSFFDPVVTENGRYAFIAKLSGNGAPKSAVFTTLLGQSDLTPTLQEGKALAVNGNLAGFTLKSVSSVSLRGNSLIALATIAGPDVTKKNNRALIVKNGGAEPFALLRTGVTSVSGSEVKSITVLSNSKGSTGHGRSQGGSRTTARLTLMDGRSVVVMVDNTTGTITSGPATDGDASALVSGGTWKSLSLPSIGGVASAAVLGTAKGDAVQKGADTGIVYTTNGTAYSKLVAEGGTINVPGVNNAKYTAFADPVVSANSRVAFLADISGSGVSKKNKTTVWAGSLSPLQAPSLVARQGDPATDTAGDPGSDKWTSFLSLALPGGSTGGPLFTAKVAAKKNNLGLWGRDSGGKLRQLIRTGDVIDLSTGDTVKGFTLFQASPGSPGATRNFNSDGTVGVLLKFKKGQAIYALGIP